MAHIHEKIDFVADVFVVYKDKVLIRKHDKYDKWLAVGGHIELDEDPNRAAIREVKEEVGLDVELVGEKLSFENEEFSGYRDIISPRYMNIHDISNVHKHIPLIYFAKSTSDNVVEEAEKSKGYKWFTKEALDKNEEGLSEPIKFYASKALEELGD